MFSREKTRQKRSQQRSIAASLVLLASLLVNLPLTARAEMVSGTLLIDIHSQKKLALPDGEIYVLKAANDLAAKALSRLSSGDRLIGDVERLNNILELRSIQFVGLRNLHGHWGGSGLGKGHKYYEFEKDFKHLAIYEDRFFSGDNQDVSTALFKYHLFPSASQTWSIILSNGETRYTGNIVMHGSQLGLSIIDPRTGLVVHRVKLRKLSE